jgi:hypothetical protein
MTRVLIQPEDRLVQVAEELEPLVNELRNAGYEVELTDPERVGHAVTWWEVVGAENSIRRVTRLFQSCLKATS